MSQLMKTLGLVCQDQPNTENVPDKLEKHCKETAYSMTHSPSRDNLYSISIH